MIQCFLASLISPCLYGLKDSNATYFECSEELIEIDSAILVSVEMVQKLLSFLFGQIEAIVDESPSEVIDIELSVSGVVHCFENTSDTFDASR